MPRAVPFSGRSVRVIRIVVYQYNNMLQRAVVCLYDQSYLYIIDMYRIYHRCIFENIVCTINLLAIPLDKIVGIFRANACTDVG